MKSVNKLQIAKVICSKVTEKYQHLIENVFMAETRYPQPVTEGLFVGRTDWSEGGVRNHCNERCDNEVEERGFLARYILYCIRWLLNKMLLVLHRFLWTANLTLLLTPACSHPTCSLFSFSLRYFTLPSCYPCLSFLYLSSSSTLYFSLYLSPFTDFLSFSLSRVISLSHPQDEERES